MKDINDLLQERGNLIEQMRSLSAKHSEGFDEATQSEYNAIDARQEEVKVQADRIARENAIAHEVSSAPKAQKIALEQKEEAKATNRKEYVNSLMGYLRRGQYSNALEVGTAGEGGYLTHDDFDANFREVRDDYNALRPFVDVITTTGDHNIRVEASNGVSVWGDEESAYAEGDSAFGNVQLVAHKLKRLVKVSEELLQDSDFNIEGYLASAFGRSHGMAEETAFIAGSGSGQPTGLIGGAVAVTTAETSITENALYDLFFGLGRVYRGQGTFIVNDASVRTIRGIVNGSGDKIWQPSLMAGTPDMILGRPFITSSSMGVATTSPEECVAIFGDLKNYTVADRTGLSVLRLNELYRNNGQVGFQASSRVDGKVVQAAGIKKLVLAAS